MGTERKSRSPESRSNFNFRLKAINNFIIMSRFCTTFDLVNPSETIRDLKHNLETVATSENIKISKMGTYHVQGIHALCPREVLHEQFEKHGEVVDIFNTGKGSAIVKIKEEAETEACIKELDGMFLNGQNIKVKRDERKVKGTNTTLGHQKEQDGANNKKKEPLDMDQNNNKGDLLHINQNNNKGEPLEVAEGLMEALCHIQTKIVRYLDQNDLKNCRLVSRAWSLSMDTWIWANILRSWLRFWSDKRVKFNNGIQNSVEKWSKLTEQVLASRNFSDAKNLVEFMQSKKGFLFWAMTPLQQAMRADLKNHEEKNMVMFEFCLRYGQIENIDEINGKGNTLRHEAIVLQSIKALGFRNFEKVRYIINVMANIDVENSEGQTPLIMSVIDGHLELVEELLRHPDIDVQTKIIKISHYPLGFLIEEAEKLADAYDSEEFEGIMEQNVFTRPSLSSDENAIVFQGTLLHHVVLHGSFELFKTLYPHFIDKNPEAEPGTPYEYMTPLDIAAYQGKKDVYDFLIEQIGAENLGEIPEFVHCLACGSESEDSEDFQNTFYEDLDEARIDNTENSDDYETGSGSSENSGDSESSDDYKEAKGSEYSDDFSDCKTVGSGDETNEE